MELRILTAADIRRLLPMAACVDLMERTMVTVSQGKAVLPLRNLMTMPGDIGMLGNMQGYIADPGVFGVKLVSLFPRNAGTKYSSHLGLVLLFEPDHGCPIALMDGAEITAIRTAAASGAATRHLARADAKILAVLGNGEQATKHIEAMLAVRPISEIQVWARNADKAQSFAREQAKLHNVTAIPMATVAEAVKGADIICTTTHASEPILQGGWVPDGCHLNVVGSSVPSTAEIDTPLVAKSKFFVDYHVSTENQAGEYLRALKEGAITPAHILAEIGEVINGDKPGRQSDSDITLYKSLGISAQDLTAGHYVFEKAKAQGVGQTATL
ncbi:MAG: ornithine cyclodeaminase family protein [Sphingomonadales bacterium]|nr:ornithine cyclodeaminase family protein [Sphingomonadales bacterium]